MNDKGRELLSKRIAHLKVKIDIIKELWKDKVDDYTPFCVMNDAKYKRELDEYLTEWYALNRIKKMKW